MHEDKYLIKDGEFVVARDLTLTNALILVRGLFEEYFNDKDISYEIVKESDND